MKKLTFLLMMISMSIGHAFADTTFVSGAVSGEWTRDGNPYIVVDSTWVPEGDTLFLMAGVEAFFREGQGLDIFGILYVNGVDLGNKVRLNVVDGVSNWKGLRFYGRNQTIWNWVEMRAPQKAILLSPRYSVIMNNCELSVSGGAFRGVFDDNRIFENCNLIFNNCQIAGGMYWVPVGGSIIADHTTIHMGVGDTTDMPGFSGENTDFRFTNCEIYGGIYNNLGTTIIENSRFLRPGQRYFIFAPVHGEGCRMTNTYVEGGSGAYGINGLTEFKNNTVLGDCGFSGTNVLISNSEIMGESHVAGHLITIKHSTLGRGFSIGNADSVIIDSSALIHEHQRFNTFRFDAYDEERSCNLIVTHSILNAIYYSISSRIYDRTVIFNHNTFIIDSADINVLFAPTLDNRTTLTNNIFYRRADHGLLGITPGITPFEYNCVWKFDYASGVFDSLINVDVLDSTNILEDPRLEWFVNFPLLSENSPCIDAGDPNAPRDPDGTRSDIGVRYFHQGNEVDELLPVAHDLGINAYPNPFNSTVTISYSTNPINREATKLGVYDLSGRLVAELFSSETLNLRAGGGGKAVGYGDPTVEVAAWDASDAPAGLYLVRLEAGSQLVTGKVMLVK